MKVRRSQIFRDARELQDKAAADAIRQSLPKKLRYRDRLGVAEPPTQTELRVNNWRRAYRWIRPSDTNHTFPAYRFLRSPIGVEVEYECGEPPPRSPDPIDWQDAWELELTWRSLPRKPRWLLKLHIHTTKHPKHACRLLRQLTPPLFVHWGNWEDEIEVALAEFELELDMRKLSGATYFTSSGPEGFLMPVSVAAD